MSLLLRQAEMPKEKIPSATGTGGYVYYKGEFWKVVKEYGTEMFEITDGKQVRNVSDSVLRKELSPPKDSVRTESTESLKTEMIDVAKGRRKAPANAAEPSTVTRTRVRRRKK